jgi:hypothetical protein
VIPHVDEPREELDPDRVRCIRLGHGANCSSLGSVIDTLFATATVGAAVFTAVLAALAKEPVKVAGAREERTPPEPPGRPPP